MTRQLYELFFEPRSIVVYGASADPEKLSGRPLNYLKSFGYPGKLYAINGHRDEVQGLPAYQSIAEVPGPVDLAIVVVPAESVPEALDACADRGVGAAIVFASGFAESTAAGAVGQQERMVAATKRSGLRILGPNCLGCFSEANHVFATFSTAFDTEGEKLDGPIALVSQSGAVGSFTYSTMIATGLGVRYFANTGNQVDVTAIELLAALVERADVDILLGHLEAFQDLPALERLATRAEELKKPLVMLKAGRTQAGQRAIGAHTASEGGDDQLFTSTLRAHGAVRATSMEEMTDFALAFSPRRHARGRRVTIVTLSGGAGALAADAASDYGLVVEPLDESTQAVIAKDLPYFASTLNPIDLTGAMINDVGLLERALKIASESAQTDVLLVILGNADRAAPEVVKAVTEAYVQTGKPTIVSWTGGTGTPRRELLAAGVPTYSEPQRAIKAIAQLVDFSGRSASWHSA